MQDMPLRRSLCDDHMLVLYILPFINGIRYHRPYQGLAALLPSTIASARSPLSDANPSLLAFYRNLDYKCWKLVGSVKV